MGLQYSVRYLDRFSARSGNPNWKTDPDTYFDTNIMERIEELQSLGYLIELTFLEKKVDQEQEF